MEKIKLLMADDNHAVLSQLSDFFSRKADIEIAGCAHDGAESWRKMIANVDAAAETALPASATPVPNDEE